MEYHSPTKLGWLTNDPVAANKLRAADKAYDHARACAGGLSLAEKVIALRKARAARDRPMMQ